ncbi:unnamed protein product [Durusdinium trenchii]|uniref:Uncharacterized protein n=1 Tax=Durusdinium trenchii TaxID=1381693 RepID=A0ABP0KVU3_9DINO
MCQTAAWREVEEAFESSLGADFILERESCVEILRWIGGTLQEANLLLKEHDQQGQQHLRVRDFLNLLTGRKPAPVQSEDITSRSNSEPHDGTIQYNSIHCQQIYNQYSLGPGFHDT